MHSHTKISPRFLPPRSPCTHYPHLEMPLVYCYTHSSICHRSHEPKIETDGEHNTVHVKKKTVCNCMFLHLSHS